MTKFGPIPIEISQGAGVSEDGGSEFLESRNTLDNTLEGCHRPSGPEETTSCPNVEQVIFSHPSPEFPGPLLSPRLTNFIIY